MLTEQPATHLHHQNPQDLSAAGILSSVGGLSVDALRALWAGLDGSYSLADGRWCASGIPLIPHGSLRAMENRGLLEFHRNGRLQTATLTQRGRAVAIASIRIMTEAAARAAVDDPPDGVSAAASTANQLEAAPC